MLSKNCFEEKYTEKIFKNINMNELNTVYMQLTVLVPQVCIPVSNVKFERKEAIHQFDPLFTILFSYIWQSYRGTSMQRYKL